MVEYEQRGDLAVQVVPLLQGPGIAVHRAHPAVDTQGRQVLAHDL